MAEQLSSLNIVFAGTPDFSAAHLKALIDENIPIKAVYCQPDRPKGRGKKLQPPPTKQLAESLSIPVYQPTNFKSSIDTDELKNLQPDLMIVVAYGLILPEAVLSIPRFGCINVHASSLPRWRGAAPIERAIESGDTQTGITIMQMDAGLDTGPMLNHESLAITSDTTGDSLREGMQSIGGNLLIKTLHQLVDHTLHPKTQDNDQATYANKLKKSEAQLDWTLPAKAIHAKIRAFNSSNVCFTLINNERIKIWQADIIDDNTALPPGSIISITKQGIDVACFKSVLRITSMQLPGGKPLSVQSLLNGNKLRFAQGSCFE